MGDGEAQKRVKCGTQLAADKAVGSPWNGQEGPTLYSMSLLLRSRSIKRFLHSVGEIQKKQLQYFDATIYTNIGNNLTYWANAQ